MENVVRYFNTIESSFKRTKLITVSALVTAAVIALGSLVYSAMYVAAHNDNIYLVDNNGSAMSASKVNEAALQRELEIQDHVTRFHELMFNLSPSEEFISQSMERAFMMCDRSAFTYYNGMDERGYYSTLIRDNIVQYILVDSVKVDMATYPYQEKTYGRLFISRESNLSKYIFESVGQLVDVGRSKSNPHGLMLERFQVVRNENVNTRRRR